MIYSIVGEDMVVRNKALQELAKLGAISHRVYSEHIHLLESLIDAQDMFGGYQIISCVQLLDGSGKEVVTKLLPKMEESQNIFIIDESVGDANKIKKLEKYSKKLFDARVEKKKDTSVFTFVNAFARRDKKNAWLLFLKVKDKNEGEMIQGAMWWKWKEIWQMTLEGRETKFSLEECEKIGKMLFEAPIKAHRGEADLMVELEKVVLTV